jgi:NAD(P)-dependent dehydrogenase (short-subunit alcohol dehydrogenase family)
MGDSANARTGDFTGRSVVVDGAMSALGSAEAFDLASRNACVTLFDNVDPRIPFPSAEHHNGTLEVLRNAVRASKLGRRLGPGFVGVKGGEKTLENALPRG